MSNHPIESLVQSIVDDLMKVPEWDARTPVVSRDLFGQRLRDEAARAVCRRILETLNVRSSGCLLCQG